MGTGRYTHAQYTIWPKWGGDFTSVVGGRPAGQASSAFLMGDGTHHPVQVTEAALAFTLDIDKKQPSPAAGPSSSAPPGSRPSWRPPTTRCPAGAASSPRAASITGRRQAPPDHWFRQWSHWWVSVAMSAWHTQVGLLPLAVEAK